MDTPIRALPAPTTEQVFLVSPPVTPPWLNGSVLLARDLAMQGDRYRYRVLGSTGQTGLPHCAALVEGFYSPGQRGLTRNLRLVARLLRPDGCKIQHFFFAPHKRASSMARLTLGLNRKRSVHTLPSLPAEGTDPSSLMFADRIVVLSESSAIYLRSAGVEDVRVVRPGIPVPEIPVPKHELRTRITTSGLVDMEKGPVFLYAGDLEFSNGAETFAQAAIETLRETPNATFLFACRPKTPASMNALSRVKQILNETGAAQHSNFLGVVSDMETLLGAVDAVVMPVDSLYAKVDMPFVLLQAMALGTPVIVSDLGPLTELAGLGGGAWVVNQSDPKATAQAMNELANDEAKSLRMGRAARSTIALNFRPQDMVHRYESIYDELI
jgi:glycosyltransferase involved in cell wall biosynthesis